MGVLYTAAILILALVFVLLFFGWKHSTRLRRDLLLVGEREPRPGVWVRAQGSDSITPEIRAPRQGHGPSRHPGAGHVVSWNADPARYERVLRGFLAGLSLAG